MTKLEDKIKHAVQDKKPKPKSYFVIQNTLREIIVAILWLACVVLLGAIIYLLQYFPWRVFIRPRFFLHGMAGLPWELVFLAALLIVVLYFLTKNISTFYRHRNILIAALVVSLLAGYFIAELSGLNETIAKAKPLKPLYQQYGKFIAPERFPGTIGEITSVSENQITLLDQQGNEWTALIDDRTKMPGSLAVGKRIIVIGAINNHEIKAQEIGEFAGRRGFGNGRPAGPRRMY